MAIFIPVFVVLTALAIVYQTITGKEINIFTQLIDLIMETIGFVFDMLGKLLYCLPFIGGIVLTVYVIPGVAKFGIFAIISMILIIVGLFAAFYNQGMPIMCLGILIAFLPFSTNFIFGSFLFNGSTVNVDWFWNVIISSIVISLGIIIAQIGKVKLQLWCN
jgi:hypothetical protein